jgi:dienelactone hydrolase
MSGATLMRFAASLILLASLMGPAPAAPAQPVFGYAGLGDGMLASVMLPAPGGAPAALVILLPDATGELGRSDAYVDALARLGIASLVLGIEDQGEGNRASIRPPPGREAVELAREWADGQAPLIGGLRIAIIGFGAGARVALAVEDAPVVALDPGCRGLALAPAPRQALLVHGLAAADARECAALEGPSGLTRLPLPGVGHGWDLPVVAAPGGALLPDPSGPTRRRAAPDPIATAAVAEAVASWIATRLREPAP